jgi:hypothetical protein
VTRLGVGRMEFDSRRGRDFFLFDKASRPTLGLTQPPIQWIPGVVFSRVKRPVRKANHSFPSSAEVKNAWSYSCTLPYIFIAWGLVKHRFISIASVNNLEVIH